MGTSDEDKVKAKLVKMLEKATKVDEVVALSNAFTKLRAVELKQEDGAWGEGLEQPTDSHNAAQVRS